MSDIVERLTETATLLPKIGFVGVGQEAAEAAARIEELERENERLREALTQERLENLWKAYNTGHEKADQWCHAFMSDGEWLIVEIGLDPEKGWYDAAEVKRRIPDAAARAALQGETP